jgi:hypothetical protein
MITRFLVLLLCLAATAGWALADPSQWRGEGWTKTDFGKSKIKWGEILSGGPPKDGIPSIDNPVFKPVPEIRDLAPNDPVITVGIGEDVRAYPLRIMIWHEIVNDVVGDRPVTITYCPLCNSAVVFDRRVGGRLLDFGTTGKLRNSDLVMYDRQTESWWQQFTGEAIVGTLLGNELKLVAARLESFGDFKTKHPRGNVLVPSNPDARRYGQNPYVGYDSSRAPFLYRGDLPTDIDPMARVVVVRTGSSTPLIVTLAHLRKSGSLTIDRVRLTWRSGQASALDHVQIAEGRDVGTVEAYELRPGNGAEPLPYDVTFAFVAHAFHPGVEMRDR